MALTLDVIGGLASTGLTSAEGSLSTVIAGVQSSSSAGMGEIVALQVSMSKFTIISNTYSAIVKEVTDTIKGVVAKLS